MGCGGSSSSTKGADAIQHGNNSAGGITEDDDFGWIKGDSGPRAPSPAPSVQPFAAASTPLDFETEVWGGSRPMLRIQVLLSKGWVDCGADETRQLIDKMGTQKGGKFTIEARGQTYEIDKLANGELTQTNVSTGMSRSLRLICPNATEDRAEDGTDVDEKMKAGRDLVKTQKQYGEQSRRGASSQAPLRLLDDSPHATAKFKQLLENEKRLCGEFCVFYHSYSFAAIIYEVQAAVGSVLFRFRSQYAPLPRVLVHEFTDIPDATTLITRFNSEFATNKRDHHPAYRKVAISVMCSLACTGPEACIAMVFIKGYSCKNMSFRRVLENLLENCYVQKPKVAPLADDIIKLAEKHGLDVSQFGGRPCASGKAGHLMQIFVRRSIVDKLAYAAKPYGPVDDERMPISQWMNSNKSFSVGQARIVAHPKLFMQANYVRMYVSSADETFDKSRIKFQTELVKRMSEILGEKELRQQAAEGIYGGTLPPWYSAEDQRMYSATSTASIH